MKLKLKTAKLQEMVSKAIKGASNNKMIPLTSLMEIELVDGVLTIRTTDANTTLSIVATGIEGERFHTVVPSDVFSKLVAKTTTETISLSMDEAGLEVKGNGRYNIELPMDDSGKLVKFQQVKMPDEVTETTISTALIKTILTANKAAIAQTMEQPYLTGYYVGDKVITTDSFKVCSNNEKVLGTPQLLPQEMVDLLALISAPTINVTTGGSKICFATSDVVIKGTVMQDIELYPVDAIEAYLLTEFKSRCHLPKLALIDVLERLSLFVSIYDKNGVYVTFMDKCVELSSKRSNGVEVINYQQSENPMPYTCCIDIELFKSQIAAQETEVVELWFGHERAIKMVSGKITQIVSLLEDDRLNGEASA